ncbi:hypothetical protein [Sulfitobacter sp. PM12]|uniref:hypothetical protein n=1 Tax=Sulfitobacter sp. PM12 TaxID=3138497 RepID=UPI00388FD806
MTLSQILFTGVAGLAVLAAGTLLFLPRDVTVVRTGLVPATPQAIVALAASNTGYQSFNPYMSSDPDLKIETFGPGSGVGSGFRFEGAEGKGQQTGADVQDGAVQYDIDLGPMGQPTQRISAIQRGDQADMGFNPIARIMGLFLDRMVGPTFDRGLENMVTEFAET